MKRKRILIKLLLSLIGLLGVTAAKAQISSLGDFTTGTPLAVYCPASPIKLAATSTGAASYVWKRYTGTAVTGTATAVGDNTANLSDTPAGPGFYTYVSTSLNTDGCESGVSTPITIYVLPGINVSIASNNPITKYCTNQLPAGLTLTATASKAQTVPENFAYSYQWYRNGTLISGETNSTYTLNNTNDIAPGTTNTYTVNVNYVIKACTDVVSNSISFDVIALPTTPIVTITP